MLRSDASFENLTDTDPLWQALGIAKRANEDGTSTWMVASAVYKGFGFFRTVGNAFSYSFRIGGTIFKVLGQLFTGHLGLEAFGGPVTTIKLTSQIASQSSLAPLSGRPTSARISPARTEKLTCCTAG